MDIDKTAETNVKITSTYFTHKQSLQSLYSCFLKEKLGFMYSVRLKIYPVQSIILSTEFQPFTGSPYWEKEWELVCPLDLTSVSRE